MRLLAKNKLEKLKKKNRGNQKLVKAIDQLIVDIENSDWEDELSMKSDRPDADCVHNDGFYFFNINIHRSMILIEFMDDEASIVWCGNHDDYERIFENNKDTIEKWLRKNDYI